jgi:hypothetical protein
MYNVHNEIYITPYPEIRSPLKALYKGSETLPKDESSGGP